MSDDKLVKPPSPSEELASLVDRAAYYAQSTIQERTRAGYESDFRHFAVWAEERGLPSLPADVPTVAVYLAALADGNVEHRWTDRQGHPRSRKKAHKYASIQKVYQSIIWKHRSTGLDWPAADPAIAKVMSGIARRKGTRKKRVAPLDVEALKACLAKMRERRFEDLTIHRDRALFSLGFFGALRRGELRLIRIEDLEFTDRGLLVTIPFSKTDQIGEGQQIGITPQSDPQLCPIALLKRYLELAGITEGHIFRRIDARSDCIGPRPLTGHAIALLVKQWTERAGLESDLFSGHSMRAGFATAAAAKGVSVHNIMRQTRHKSERQVHTYIRPATVFDNNATEGLGEGKKK